MIRLSTSALITSMSRCRRSEDSPTCSGLALGRLWAKAATAVEMVKSAASSRILAFISVFLLVEDGSCERESFGFEGATLTARAYAVKQARRDASTGQP